MIRPLRVAFTLIVLFALWAPSASAQTTPVTVFAAISLKDALEETAKAFTTSDGTEIRFSFASSATIAKQIENGAPADLFASADLSWMNYLVEKSRVKSATRTNLLGNRLVVVAPFASPLKELELTPEAFLKALGDGRLAMGDIKSVPAGVYGKSALEKLGLWSTVESHVAQTENVRSALLFADRGEVPLAIVYATDAKADPNVKIVANFPADSHEPIIYPFAVTSTAKGEGADRFLNFLKGPAGKAIFEKYGFPVLVP